MAADLKCDLYNVRLNSGFGGNDLAIWRIQWALIELISRKPLKKNIKLS